MEYNMSWILSITIPFIIFLVVVHVYDKGAEKKRVLNEKRLSRFPKYSKKKEQLENFEQLNVAIKGLYYRTPSEQLRAKKLKYGERLFLLKEPNNQYDKYAIKVYTTDFDFIGYIDKNYSKKTTIFLDKGIEVYCFITKVTSNSIPYIYADLYFDIIEYDKLTVKRKTISRPDPLSLTADERKKRIIQLRGNIRRAKAAVVKHCSEDNDTGLNSAIKNFQKHEEELRVLNEIENS